jgi:hypothetical protein
MRPSIQARHLVFVCALAGSFLPLRSQEPTGGDGPPLCEIVGTWRSSQGTVTITWRSPRGTIAVIQDRDGQIVLTGERQWKGKYDSSSGQAQLTYELSAAEVREMEDRQEVPPWVRDRIAKKPIHKHLILTFSKSGDPDGSLAMTGQMYDEKVEYQEETDEKTGAPILASRKAWIVAGSDSQPMGATYTNGLSPESRKELDYHLGVGKLFNQRWAFIRKQKDIEIDIAATEKSYDALNTTKAGPAEITRLEEIHRRLKSYHADWDHLESQIEQNRIRILDGAVEQIAYYNRDARDLIEKYVQLKQVVAEQPDKPQYKADLENTGNKILLTLGQGADATNWYDDQDKREFLYGMIQVQAGFAGATAIGSTSEFISKSCPAAVLPKGRTGGGRTTTTANGKPGPTIKLEEPTPGGVVKTTDSTATPLPEPPVKPSKLVSKLPGDLEPAGVTSEPRSGEANASSGKGSSGSGVRGEGEPGGPPNGGGGGANSGGAGPAPDGPPPEFSTDGLRARRTDGWFRTKDGEPVNVGSPRNRPDGVEDPGFNWTDQIRDRFGPKAAEVAQHAEGRAAMLVEQSQGKVSEAWIDINNNQGPCLDCRQYVQQMLPPGSSLTVRWETTLTAAQLEQKFGAGVTLRNGHASYTLHSTR